MARVHGSALEARNKPATRRQIADRLRRMVVSGELRPGAQLPIRTRIEQEFGASPATVQHAFDLLRHDGFIHVNGRQGTYVVEHPPHLYHFALVFNQHVSGHTANRLFQCLLSEAALYDGSRGDPRRISTHFGVEDHVDNLQMRHLRSAVRNHCLAGLIFPENPFTTRLASSFLGTAPGLPRVALIGDPTDSLAAVTFAPFAGRALDYLAKQGCQRIAVLSNLFDVTSVERFASDIRQHGMTTRPYWIQSVELPAAAAARRLVNLLFHRGQDERPDGFLITDDNLVEHAMGGLIDAGMRVPQDVQVVTHCNFPEAAPKVLPVKRLGYHIHDVMAAFLELLAEQQQGHKPGKRVVNPVFEDEISPPSSGMAIESVSACVSV